jgi:hephaestin
MKAWRATNILVCSLVLGSCGSRSPEAVSAQAAATPQGKTRTYYVAADVVAWDYAPSGMDQITGAPFSPIASLWTVRGPEQLGRVYKKALFREYSDGSFKTLKPRPPEWQ